MSSQRYHWRRGTHRPHNVDHWRQRNAVEPTTLPEVPVVAGTAETPGRYHWRRGTHSTPQCYHWRRGTQRPHNVTTGGEEHRDPTTLPLEERNTETPQRYHWRRGTQRPHNVTTGGEEHRDPTTLPLEERNRVSTAGVSE